MTAACEADPDILFLRLWRGSEWCTILPQSVLNSTASRRLSACSVGHSDPCRRILVASVVSRRDMASEAMRQLWFFTPMCYQMPCPSNCSSCQFQSQTSFSLRRRRRREVCQKPSIFCRAAFKATRNEDLLAATPSTLLAGVHTWEP